MKIAVMGSNSFIGNSICEYLKERKYETVGLSRSVGKNTDFIVNLEESERIDINTFSDCQYLIFAAAISSPDLCETQTEMCHKINVEGTIDIIGKALNKGLKVIFFSSDAVYGADSTTRFDEKSDANPISSYGSMKREVEVIFENEKNFVSLRLAYVFSYLDKFTKYYISCIDSKKDVEVFHPFYRNVICIDDVLMVVEKLICNWRIVNSTIINLCGMELISRVTIADTINRVLNNEYDYKIIKKEDSFFKIRPKVTEMKSLYLKYILENLDESFYEKAYKEIKKYR